MSYRSKRFSYISSPKRLSRSTSILRGIQEQIGAVIEPVVEFEEDSLELTKSRLPYRRVKKKTMKRSNKRATCPARGSPKKTYSMEIVLRKSVTSGGFRKFYWNNNDEIRR